VKIKRSSWERLSVLQRLWRKPSPMPLASPIDPPIEIRGNLAIRGISLEQLLELDPGEGGPLDQNSVPYRVTRRWVYGQCRIWWLGDERSSPNWMSRVRGQFPDQAKDALIKLAWLERPLERTSKNPGRRRCP
jgi:hypothetical protein